MNWLELSTGWAYTSFPFTYSTGKKVSHYQMIKKIVLNKACQLDLFVKLKYESSTIILSVGITYSMRDLLSDFNNYVWPAKSRYASDMVNDVSAFSGISSHEQVVNSIQKQSFRWSCMYKWLLFPHFLFFFWFSNVILSSALKLLYFSFKHSKWWRHKLGHT